MSNKTSDKNVAKDIEFLKSDEAEQLHFIGNPRLKNAIQNILAEREQKDKRIKELEEENTLQRRQLNSAFDNGYIHTDKIRKLIANETINISGFECIAVEDLQELLEGRNENG